MIINLLTNSIESRIWKKNLNTFLSISWVAPKWSGGLDRGRSENFREFFNSKVLSRKVAQSFFRWDLFSTNSWNTKVWHGFFVSRCVGRWPWTGPCERRALARERRPFPRSPVPHLTALESLATGLGCWNGHGPCSKSSSDRTMDARLPISQPVTLCQHALPVISLSALQHQHQQHGLRRIVS